MPDKSSKRMSGLRKHISGTLRWWLVVIFVSTIVGGVYVVMTPWNIGHLSSHPRPTRSYAEAVQRIDTLQAQEAPDMNPVCRLQFLSHDEPVERAIVLVHGYTNCPQQFRELGRRLYDLGYNVLIAPLPHHGLADRLTNEQAQLKAEELAAYADEVVDIAQGLGGRSLWLEFPAVRLLQRGRLKTGATLTWR